MNVIWTPALLAKIEMLRQQGKSLAAIAVQLGTTEGAVKAARFRHLTGREDKRDRTEYRRAWEEKNRNRRNAARRERRAATKTAE